MASKKKTAAPVEVKKQRKSYPSYDERIAAADQKIERLSKLISERAALIEKTERTLATRKAAVQKNQEALDKTIAKRTALISRRDRQAGGEKVKLTPEERAEKRRIGQAKAREKRKAEKAEFEALKAAMNKTGMTIMDLLEKVNAE